MKLVAMPQMCAASVLYGLHFILAKTYPEYNHTFIRWYFADVLALVVCIPIFINSQIFFRIRKKCYVTLIDIIIYFLLFSLYFEIIMPIKLPNLTGDLFDIIAYALGGCILYFSQKKIIFRKGCIK
jgi:drug/metabolite transporter (DMT)-like permease